MRAMRRSEAGFSLVELMVAMTVTLIVTGAVYGLLSSGQNAFRREPELTDRQQNIRTAMDLIMRDIAAAGESMPPFIQSFKPGLDGGTLSGTPTAPSGAQTDELEIITNPNNYDAEPTCDYPGGSSSNVRLAGDRTNVLTNSVVMIVLFDGNWTFRNINQGVNYPNTSAGNCDGGGGQNHANIQFNNGSDPTGYNLAGGLCAGTWNGTQCGAAPGNACVLPDLTTSRSNADCRVQSVVSAEIVRYRIRAGADNVPNLERFSSADAGAFAGGVPTTFQVVARGIDDLQVRYTNAGGATTDNAPAVDQSQLNYNSVINKVQVTLSSRAEARNIQGATTAASGPTAIRGQLVSEGTPRAALVTLATPATNRKAGWSGAEWQ